MEKTEFCIPVPVLSFHLLDLASTVVWSAHTHCSHICSHIPYQEEVHYLPRGASLNCSRAPWDIARAEREVVSTVSTPKREEPHSLLLLFSASWGTFGYWSSPGEHQWYQPTAKHASWTEEPSLLSSAKVALSNFQGRALGIVLFQLHAQPFS